eukprot:102377_1
MAKLKWLVRTACLLYIASVIRSRGKSKRYVIGIGISILYVLQKVYEIGVWKHKSKNPNIRIQFYEPGLGSTRFVAEHWDNGFFPKYSAEALKNLSESREKFVIFGSFAANSIPHFDHHIFDPKVIKYVFEDNFEDYIKGPAVHDTFEELFGDGIFAIDQPEWRFHRKVASRMFSLRNLKYYMFDSAMDNVDILVNKMEELSGTAMDLFDLFGRFTLQSFIQTAFGERLPMIQSLPNKHPFCESFDRLIVQCNLRFYDLFWKIKRYLKIGSREGVLIPHDKKVLDDFADKIINDRHKTANITESAHEKHDLLSLFLKYGGIEHKDLNKKAIRDITMNFVIAARDTTRILLSWFFYELTKDENKHILAEVKAEIDSHKEEKLSYEDCVPYSGGRKKKKHKRKYQYLEAVICEILRLYPPVPFLARYVKRDSVKIPYKTFDGVDKELILDKGDGVSVYTPAYLRLPSIWGKNGKDPNKMNVDNFYEGGVNTYTPYIFPVFNIQPRLCLGKTFALMQAKLTVISILRRFDIFPVPNQNVIAPCAPLMVMNGFKVTVKCKQAGSVAKQ